MRKQASPPRKLARYAYTPLKEGQIRLFYLDRQTGPDGEIRGQLHAYKLGDLDRYDSSAPARYTAVSYAWGPTYADGSHLSQSIECDGRKLAVTSNLKAALTRFNHVSEHLRRSDPGSLTIDRNVRDEKVEIGPYWWIDAICINQEDVQERSRQVASMPEIYERNSGLIAWLGEPDIGNSGAAQLAELNWIHWSFRSDVSFKARREKIRRNLDPEPLARPGDFLAIESGMNTRLIVSRPWFQRRWVIQELSRPPIDSYVLLGDVWCDMRRFRDRLRDLGVSNAASPLESASTRDVGPDNCFSMLYRYDEADCADPRDRIYALGAIFMRYFPVDYNLDYFQVYLEFVRRMAFGLQDNFEKDFSNRYHRSGIIVEPLNAAWADIIRVLALASCKKRKTSTDGLMEAWHPDWTIKSHFESESHKQAVDLCLLGDWTNYSSDFAALFDAPNGYCFCVLKGLTVEPKVTYLVPVSAQAEISVSNLQDMLQRFWPDDVLPSDRIWLQINQSAKAGSEALRCTSPWNPNFVVQAIAFVLRAASTLGNVQGGCAYRLHSCFVVSREMIDELVRMLDTVQDEETAASLAGFDQNAEIYLE